MTVRGGVTISSSSRCLLAGSRDTANESRYDVGLLSFQCLALESSLSAISSKML
ncbi:MAG: hypothetical protein ACEY3M_16185 [Wolbachia sp.]